MSRVSKPVREQVRERANHRCEYCYLPERIFRVPHQVDHIDPPRHAGTDEVENLAWACLNCNNSKGTDIGTVDVETRQRVWLYNPRQQDWNEHFQIESDGLIFGKTVIGRATARLLKMNVPHMIEIRRVLIEAGIW